MIYQSKIKNGFPHLFFKVIYWGLLVSAFNFFADRKENLQNLETWKWLLSGFIIILLFYIYLVLTNNDIKLDKYQIEFKRKLFPFKRTVRFKLKDISEISMQHDWTDTILENFKPNFLKYFIVEWFLKMILAEDYKWIRITANGKSNKFYCFGLEHDYYDNPKPHFEDLYLEFVRQGLNVNWTENNDVYYKEMTKRKEEIQK